MPQHEEFTDDPRQPQNLLGPFAAARCACDIGFNIASACLGELAIGRKPMNTHIEARAALGLAAVILLGACATSGSGPKGTEITRFHLGEPIPPQAIEIKPADAAEEKSLAYRDYLRAVSTELARAGFEASDSDDVQLVARVKVTRDVRYEAPKRSPFSIGIGAGGSNAAMGTSVGLGGSDGKEIPVTQLELVMESREGRQVLWEGTAVSAMEPGASANVNAVVQGLAAALLADFPGESGKTLTVE